jgi:hypothetical protein
MMWLINLFTGGLGTIVEKIFGIFGKTIVDSKKIEAQRQANENDNGTKLATAYIEAGTAAGAQRADVQKSQGAWGPLGILGFLVGLPIAFHAALVVLDSTGWYFVLTTKYYVIPWLEWAYHKPGSWDVKVLPGLFEQTEHAILQGLFYVSTGATAAIGVAKALRR